MDGDIKSLIDELAYIIVDKNTEFDPCDPRRVELIAQYSEYLDLVVSELINNNKIKDEVKRSSK